MLTRDSFRQHLILENESKMKEERKVWELEFYVPISRSVVVIRSLDAIYSQCYMLLSECLSDLSFYGTISSIKFNNMTLCTFLFRFCASNMQNVESWEKLNNISRFLYLYLSISFPHIIKVYTASKEPGSWALYITTNSLGRMPKCALVSLAFKYTKVREWETGAWLESWRIFQAGFNLLLTSFSYPSSFIRNI